MRAVSVVLLVVKCHGSQDRTGRYFFFSKQQKIKAG